MYANINSELYVGFVSCAAHLITSAKGSNPFPMFPINSLRLFLNMDKIIRSNQRFPQISTLHINTYMVGLNGDIF
jgi:hypothetical protein